MKRPGQKVTVLAVGIVLVIMLIAGCDEQNVPNTRMSRLVAAENIQLKKQLDKREAEIERQKKLLEKCQQEKKTLEKQLQEDLEGLTGVLFESFGEESARLQEENKNLKAQVEELEKELEEIRKEEPSP